VNIALLFNIFALAIVWGKTWIRMDGSVLSPRLLPDLRWMGW